MPSPLSTLFGVELRDLPSVDRLASSLNQEGLPHALVIEVARTAIDTARGEMASGRPADPARHASEMLAHVAASRPAKVINATGVLLHTNLGRAPLWQKAEVAAGGAATGYANLELDTATGERGGRGEYVGELLRTLTGAEAALVVNNNAGALFLTLIALAAGRAVPVSRGELIEIGGSYRLPELMAATGAHLMEVGTTNRTRLSDYRDALAADPALLLKVHPANYRIEGFTEAVEVEALAALAAANSIPMAFDAGSGLLDDRTPWLAGPPPPWLQGEPGVTQAVAAGADLVMFSGDKLLGGPQAGIIVGRRHLIANLRNHPVTRALRMDGPSLAALTVTIEAYADGEAGKLPFWHMALLRESHLEERARAVLGRAGVHAEIRPGASALGAGSAPGAEVPSQHIVVPNGDAVFSALLRWRPSVLARRRAGMVLIDLRTVDEEDDDLVADALAAACRS
jgi:L-seryl-tRNA(Ser) seleniumtransferase